ncbi:receptor-type tyrosine-protein phosphatase C-like isoform X2 [Toxotes jaculatrix]|uniref:receptor-type tyrosine-protein phosphatase C-like isoform X2 n=1 Tax=Toxotes jaculatrix TaxID=941984 RepID=UPI001B3AFC33|nr:receptor-type tyrosine-protein phosphatase C-like isoform X2 [Toxotes jaculatrix]
MAGLCVLKILLLWAGVIGWTKSTIPTTSPIPSNQTDSQNLTSPPVTQLITTVITTTQAPPQCSYTVTPIKFGFQFNITSSTTGDYTINIKDEDQSETAESVTVYSNQTSSHDIKDLKPCTEYEHNVAFIDAAGQENPCDYTESQTRTNDINENDIEVEANCISGHVCYRSNWDISSLQSTPAPAEQCGNKVFCFKPGINDICSDFTTTLTSENCGDSSFSLTKHIPVGFLNTTEISQNVSKQFPVKIEATLPPNCKNLSIDYTCREHDGVNEPKNLSELEPFTDYICTGQIKDNNVTIGNTAAVDFRIDCDFTIKITTERVTDTSIELEWDTTSRNCQHVLQGLQKLSYDCSCERRHNAAAEKHASGGTCHITGLKPWRIYTCEVQPKYNNKEADKKASVTRGTESGTPDDVFHLKATLPENNVIKVTCGHPESFHGPENIYRARLHYGSDTLIHKENTKCEFEFKDLLYSTSYTVEVTAFNGIHESQPETIDVDTLYNDKAVIGFLVFMIITFSTVAVVLYMIYIKKCRTSRNDMRLESTAIYVNVRPPGWHHKEAR